MSFLFQEAMRRRPQTAVVPQDNAFVPDRKTEEALYAELMDRRPALLDEKLKLHARIIDEFNLPVFEKLPREEMVRQIRTYVTDYVKNEGVPLNQRELVQFSDEIVDEMIGFGPIEP